MKFFTTQLANGLTLLGEVDELLHSASLGVFVKTGARDEGSEVAGVSHFLEHMMFKGTAKRDALQLTFDLGNIGAQANAYTSEEQTVYYASVVPEYFPAALEILCDMLRPALDEKEFNVEKKVILEEIALYEDRPTHVLLERALRVHFAGHPAGNSVLGSQASVSALSRAQMKAYFDSRYTAPNMIVAATGRFVWDDFVRDVEKYCSSWPSSRAEREIVTFRPQEQDETVERDDMQMAHVVLMSDGPASGDDRRYAAFLLAAMLGDSSGSRAYWQLIQTGLAESASVDCEPLDGTGMVMGYVSAVPENIAQAEEILHSIMRTPLEFSDEDLERAKNKFATRIVLQSESSRRRLMSLGLEWMYRHRYLTLREEIVKIESTTRADIEALVSDYSFAPVTRVRLLPRS